jgi:hypothetical protein
LGLRQSLSADNGYRRGVRWTFYAAVVTLVVATFASPTTQVLGESSTPASGGSWYRVGLDQGEWQGYHWAVGAAGPKHEPLGEICALISVIEPPQEGSPYVEASDAKVCGSLPDATVSNVLGETLGSGASKQILVAALYRPIVRKVTFVLDTGERKVYFPRTPRIPNRVAKGIPAFRYLVTSSDGETCTRRMTTFDGKGDVIWNEARPPCPAGIGNL